MFIPAAERSGLIVPLGARILEAVFRFLSQLDFAALGLENVDINLSVAQCMDPGLYDIVTGLQRRYGVRPERVILEITETTFDRISDAAREGLSRLAEAGYRLALDDYGVGYSNIQRLSRLHFDLIKLDKSLVDGLFAPGGELILRNTVRMMHDLGKQVVVEGVETEASLQALQQMSCDYIQGYYYSVPLPEEEFVPFLRQAQSTAGQERPQP